MSEGESSEYIFRVKGVRPENREKMENHLREVANRTPGRLSLTRVDREEHIGYALHLRRKKLL